MLGISYISCCLLKNLDLIKMFQCPIDLGAARNARMEPRNLLLLLS